MTGQKRESYEDKLKLSRGIMICGYKVDLAKPMKQNLSPLKKHIYWVELSDFFVEQKKSFLWRKRSLWELILGIIGLSLGVIIGTQTLLFFGLSVALLFFIPIGLKYRFVHKKVKKRVEEHEYLKSFYRLYAFHVLDPKLLQLHHIADEKINQLKNNIDHLKDEKWKRLSFAEQPRLPKDLAQQGKQYAHQLDLTMKMYQVQHNFYLLVKNKLTYLKHSLVTTQSIYENPITGQIETLIDQRPYIEQLRHIEALVTKVLQMPSSITQIQLATTNYQKYIQELSLVFLPT